MVVGGVPLIKKKETDQSEPSIIKRLVLSDDIFLSFILLVFVSVIENIRRIIRPVICEYYETNLRFKSNPDSRALEIKSCRHVSHNSISLW